MDPESRSMDGPEGTSLVLAFDTDEPGFEAGVLWGDLQATEDEVEATVHAASTEMVLRMADALGRHVVGEQLDGTWTRVVFGVPEESGAGPSPRPGHP